MGVVFLYGVIYLRLQNSQSMDSEAVNVLVFMSGLMSALLLVSNLLALKVWNLGGIPVDAGILAFPFSYIVGDLLVEIYGERIANRVATQSAGFALLLVMLMALAGLLPDFPGADNVAFGIVRSATGRMFMASVLGFLFSQWTNNHLFVKIRHRHEVSVKVRHSSMQTRDIWLVELPGPNFWRAFAKRALISSSVAHIVDSLTFETLAFYGKLPLREFISQAGFAYVASFALELLFFPATYWLALKLRQRLHFSNGHRTTE